MERLTSANLLNMYIDWIKKFGKGRNEKNIRFGQWIWINFNDDIRAKISENLKKIDIGNFEDGFHAEDPKIAYEQILKILI
jgi:hypothetical protein